MSLLESLMKMAGKGSRSDDDRQPPIPAPADDEREEGEVSSSEDEEEDGMDGTVVDTGASASAGTGAGTSEHHKQSGEEEVEGAQGPSVAHVTTRRTRKPLPHPDPALFDEEQEGEVKSPSGTPKDPSYLVGDNDPAVQLQQELWEGLVVIEVVKEDKTTPPLFAWDQLCSLLHHFTTYIRTLVQPETGCILVDMVEYANIETPAKDMVDGGRVFVEVGPVKAWLIPKRMKDLDQALADVYIKLMLDYHTQNPNLAKATHPFIFYPCPLFTGFPEGVVEASWQKGPRWGVTGEEKINSLSPAAVHRLFEVVKRERERKQSSSGGLFPRQPLGLSINRTAEEEEFVDANENLSFRQKTSTAASGRTPIEPPRSRSRSRLRRSVESSYRGSGLGLAPEEVPQEAPSDSPVPESVVPQVQSGGPSKIRPARPPLFKNTSLGAEVDLGSSIGQGPLTSSRRRAPAPDLELSPKLPPIENTYSDRSAIQELSQQLQLLNERSAQEASLSLVKLLREEGAFKSDTPRIDNFSGDDEVKGVSFELWQYQVLSLEKSHKPHTIREAMIRSLKGTAAEVVRSLSPNAGWRDILEALKVKFQEVGTWAALSTKFFQLTKGESSVSQFSVQVEAALHSLAVRFPANYPPGTKDTYLKSKFFDGLPSSYRNGLRYLMADAAITYADLLQAAREVEIELGDVKTSKDTSKDKKTKTTSDEGQSKKKVTAAAVGVSPKTQDPQVANLEGLFHASQAQVKDLQSKVESMSDTLAKVLTSGFGSQAKSYNSGGGGKGRGKDKGQSQGNRSGQGQPGWEGACYFCRKHLPLEQCKHPIRACTRYKDAQAGYWDKEAVSSPQQETHPSSKSSTQQGN